jgi:hypothetical protein
MYTLVNPLSPVPRITSTFTPCTTMTQGGTIVREKLELLARGFLPDLLVDLSHYWVSSTVGCFDSHDVLLNIIINLLDKSKRRSDINI